MFAARTTKDVPTKYHTDAGGVVDGIIVIRKLAGKQLKHAAEVQRRSAMAESAAVSPELLKALSSHVAEGVADARKERASSAASPAADRKRYRAYDRDAVLYAAVVAWRVAGITLPEVSPAAIDGLDEETADLLHREAVDLSEPPPAADMEAAAKNA